MLRLIQEILLGVPYIHIFVLKIKKEKKINNAALLGPVYSEKEIESLL